MNNVVVYPNAWEEHTENYKDGDWDIRFLFDGYTVSVGGVIATNPWDAITLAGEVLPKQIFDEEVVEVAAHLQGTYN